MRPQTRPSSPSKTQGQPRLHPSGVELPVWLAAAFFVGAAAILAGGYWDDGWHTERGRDEFFIAPHLVLYGGVTLTGAVLALWLLLAARGALA